MRIKFRILLFSINIALVLLCSNDRSKKRIFKSVVDKYSGV